MMDEIRERLEGKIERYGHGVMNIFADAQRGMPGLSYSVGLQDRGWPELVLTGAPPEMGQAIINRAIELLSERGQPPREGEILDELLASGPARMRALSPAEVEANLILACARSRDLGRDPPAAFQIIYQDPEGRWPEDPAYSCRMALMLAQAREETRQ